MAVLEITLLTVKPPISPSSPAILSSLQAVRSALAASVYPTRSRFYQKVRTPNEIYILGVWPSLARHQEFLANSRLRDEILAPQEGLMEFEWGLHLDLEGRGEDAVCRFLADANGLEIGRWGMSASKTREFSEMLERQEREEKTDNRGTKIAEGWVMDTRDDSGKQYVRIRGWEKMEHAGTGLDDHEGFGKGGWLLQEEIDAAEMIEVKVLRNLEGSASSI